MTDMTDTELDLDALLRDRQLTYVDHSAKGEFALASRTLGPKWRGQYAIDVLAKEALAQRDRADGYRDALKRILEYAENQSPGALHNIACAARQQLNGGDDE